MFNKIVTSLTEQYVFGFSFHSFCIGCTGLCPCTGWFKRLLDEQQLPCYIQANLIIKVYINTLIYEQYLNPCTSACTCSTVVSSLFARSNFQG